MSKTQIKQMASSEICALTLTTFILYLVFSSVCISSYFTQLKPANKRWKHRSRTNCIILEKDINVSGNEGYYMRFSYSNPFASNHSIVITDPIRVDRSTKKSAVESTVLMSRSINSTVECYPNESHDVLFSFDRKEELIDARNSVKWTGWAAFSCFIAFCILLAAIIVRKRRSNGV